MSETLIFDALSDGVRRQILEHLSEVGECSVTELASNIDSVGRTAVSNHLRLLRTSGVVRERREGRKHFYSLDREGSVGAAVSYLQRILDLASADLHSFADNAATEDERGFEVADSTILPLQRRSS